MDGDKKIFDKDVLNFENQMEERAQEILEATPDAMIITNKEGQIIFANTQTEKVFGYEKNELLGKSVEILIPEPYRGRHPKNRQNYFKAPRTRPMGIGKELYGQRKNNEIFSVEISLSPLKTKEGMLALAAIRDITERKKAEKEINELSQSLLITARHAGMAEVANSTLHNIGNILNSINISIGIISDNSKQSNLVKGLKRILNLIQENSLNEYILHNEQGKNVSDYIKSLTEIAEIEHANMSDEIQSLYKHVSMAIDFISKQKSISGYSLFPENTVIAEVIESALKMSDVLNQDINIKKYFDTIPIVNIDKNKLLQILINVITNSKDALYKNNHADKVLALSIKKIKNNCINIIVEDNGVGIPAENLKHIFSFGFSTKEDKHGFGLHNSWLLANEMGASINIKSDGPSKGAIFTLSLPVNNFE